ncbi:MAG: DUF459 domain-containing protein [Helicobacter sp.]|nr:DUF459 domain-containing protein [Helicobacter sp.]
MRRILTFWLVAVATLLLTSWLLNAPILRYVQQQHYATNYPYLAFFDELTTIPDNAFFDFGNRIKNSLSFAPMILEIPSFEPIAPKDEPKQPSVALLPAIDSVPANTHETNQTNIAIVEEIPNTTQNLPTQNLPTLPEQTSLQKGDVVVLIGDSLMQGVGMTLVSMLKKHGAVPINLSKQSTGLTYNHHFDWEKALSSALLEQPVQYVIIMLGANDPWDMIDPENKARYIKFKTERWEEIYRARIQSLLTLAHEHGAQVFWFEAPYMKKEKLNDGVLYLNTLYEDEARQNGAIFLHSNDVLSDDATFSAYITRNDKKIKVRTNDGIHFSGEGSRILSKLLLQHLLPAESEQKE